MCSLLNDYWCLIRLVCMGWKDLNWDARFFIIVLVPTVLWCALMPLLFVAGTLIFIFFAAPTLAVAVELNRRARLWERFLEGMNRDGIDVTGTIVHRLETPNAFLYVYLRGGDKMSYLVKYQYEMDGITYQSLATVSVTLESFQQDELPLKVLPQYPQSGYPVNHVAPYLPADFVTFSMAFATMVVLCLTFSHAFSNLLEVSWFGPVLWITVVVYLLCAILNAAALHFLYCRVCIYRGCVAHKLIPGDDYHAIAMATESAETPADV